MHSLANIVMTNKHRTWIEVDIHGFRKNIQMMKSRLEKGVEFLSMVKANAYSHGALRIADVAIREGSRFLGVAYPEEAFELRKGGLTHPILLFSEAEESIPDLFSFNITPTVYTLNFAKKLSNYASKKNVKIKVHIKIDTGLNRLGIQSKNGVRIVEQINKLPQVIIEGIYTHFANAYSSNLSFTKKQFSDFLGVIRTLKKKSIIPKYIHASNSASFVWFPESHFNLVRFGMAMYGLEPSANKSYPLRLKKTFSWKTRVLLVKEIKKGENVGYGNYWHAKKNLRMATIAVGYSDGFRKEPYNFKYVLHKGVKRTIIGNVAMSHSMIDITGSSAEIGDEIVIIGKQGKNEITLEDIGSITGTSNEEILTSISNKISRIYL